MVQICVQTKLGIPETRYKDWCLANPNLFADWKKRCLKEYGLFDLVEMQECPKLENEMRRYEVFFIDEKSKKQKEINDIKKKIVVIKHVPQENEERVIMSKTETKKVEVVGVKRGRGRPAGSKNKTTGDRIPDAVAVVVDTATKRGRGRPKKNA